MQRMLRITDKTDPFKSAFENPRHPRSIFTIPHSLYPHP